MARTQLPLGLLQKIESPTLPFPELVLSPTDALREDESLGKKETMLEIGGEVSSFLQNLGTVLLTL
jgi:hypothetical protein